MSEIDPYDELKKQMAAAKERFASEVHGATRGPVVLAEKPTEWPLTRGDGQVGGDRG